MSFRVLSFTASCASLIALTAANALAQSLPQTEEVIIQATRSQTPASAIPAMVTVVDQEDLTQQLAIFRDLNALLGNLSPGFAPSRQKLSGFGESFRGRSPLFLIDGVPQSNPLRDGSRDAYTIDLAVVERIEVINGANAIQGLGATGGIVNFVTRKADDSGDLSGGFDVGITAGDDFNGNGFETRASAYLTKDFGKIDVIVSAGIHSRGVFYDGAGRAIGVDTTQGDLADSDQRNFFGKVGLDIDEDQRLQLTINDFRLAGDGDFARVDGDRDAGIPTTAIDGEEQGLPPMNDVTTLSLDYIHADLGGARVTAQLYYQNFESVFGGGSFGVFQDPSIAEVGTLFDQSSNMSEKIGGRLTVDAKQAFGTPIDITAGVDVLRDTTSQALILTDRLWVPETTYQNYAPFVQASLPLLNDRLVLGAGLRYEIAELQVEDYNAIAGNRSGSDFLETPVIGGSPTFDDVLFNASIIGKITDALQVYATYAQAYTIPDVGRVLRAVSVVDTRVDDLLTLSPIIADNYEIGASLTKDWLTAQVAYYISASDEGSRLVADEDGIFSVSREKTRIEGFEAKIEAQATSSLALGGNLSILNGQVDTDDDGELDADLGAVNVAPNRLNLYVSYADGPISGRLQTSTVFDASFEDAAGEESAAFDGYTTVDLYAGYALEVGTISLGLQNLLDKEYITYFSQAGTTRADQFFAGRGRTMTLNYRFDF